MNAPMADDMVWHNEGRQSPLWIGPWNGKEAILIALPIFGANSVTTAWDNTQRLWPLVLSPFRK
jgi:hypothetical protein